MEELNESLESKQHPETNEEEMKRYKTEKRMLDATFEYLLQARREGMTEAVFRKELEANHDRFRKLIGSLSPGVLLQVTEELQRKVYEQPLINNAKK